MARAGGWRGAWDRVLAACEPVVLVRRLGSGAAHIHKRRVVVAIENGRGSFSRDGCFNRADRHTQLHRLSRLHADWRNDRRESLGRTRRNGARTVARIHLRRR